MNNLKSMDKTDLRNKFIVFSKVVLVIFIIMLLAIIFFPENEIELPGPIGALFVIIGVVCSVTLLAVIILETVATVKCSGTIEIGGMLVQIAIMSAILYFGDKWLNPEESSTIVYWMSFAAFVVFFGKVPEYWKRYDSEYAKKNKK